MVQDIDDLLDESIQTLSEPTNDSVRGLVPATAGLEPNRAVQTRPTLPSLPGRLTLEVPTTSRILVVDDETDVAESLAEFLQRKEGYKIDVTHSGKEAIQFLERTVGSSVEVDLVLLDMLMPGLSGLEVLDWIRKHSQLGYMRVVMLTATANPDQKVQALSAGADDYITKPYNLQELLARVKTILRTQQLEKQLHRQSQQLAALNHESQGIAGMLETNRIESMAVRAVLNVLETDLAALLMLEGGRLHCHYLRHYKGSMPPHIFPAVERGQGILGLTWNEQRPFVVNDVTKNGRYDNTIDSPLNFTVRSMITAPLTVRRSPVGVLAAYNKRDGVFSDFDLDLFASLASSISQAIENSWLFQRIRHRHQELLEGRNTLQALIDGIPNPIYTINDDWELVAINKSKADQLSTIPTALTGHTCFRAFYGRSSPCDHCTVAHTLANKEERHWPVRWVGDDHLPREWDVSAYPIPGKQASSARAVIVWQDKTEERRLESSLMQAGKLAAIGQLAAGVAHEINNPLTAINANAEMLKMLMPIEDENYEAVELIARAGDRAAKVVRGLLDFARQEQYDFALGNLNQSIKEALQLVNYQLQSASIEVTTDFDETLPETVSSWEHLKSVWLNLLLNARDAVQSLPTDRHIELITRSTPDPDYVQIHIRDNGKGMSDAERAHIFEPFYTTKDPGKGTGLGLATCHRIIEQHGGVIDVVSQPLEGTSFIVRLPIRPPRSNR